MFAYSPYMNFKLIRQQGSQQQRDAHRECQRSAEAFPSLGRRDMGDHLVTTNDATREIRAHVGELRHRDQISDVNMPDRMMQNRRAEVTLTSTESVEVGALAPLGQVLAIEQRTMGPRGPGIALFLFAVVGTTVSVVAAAGLLDTWDWPTVRLLAQRQADLISAS